MTYKKLDEWFNTNPHRPYHFNKKENRIVITGTSGTGKTSIVNTILDHGKFTVVEEVARKLITRFETEDPAKLPWNDHTTFQNILEGTQLRNYFDNKSAFFDRSFVDEIAYRKYFGMVVPDFLYALAENLRFEKVFLIESWKEIYVQDAVRKETFEQACLIEEHLIAAYKEANYDLIPVPKVAVEDRVLFIYDEYFPNWSV